MMPKKTKPMYLSAGAGFVLLIGDGATVALTPEVAVEIAADLPKFAAQARLLAGEELNIDYMAATLTQLGYVWNSGNPGHEFGHWVQSDGDEIGPAEPFERATRRTFSEIVCGEVGPVL
jgi:hypothetical protein